MEGGAGVPAPPRPKSDDCSVALRAPPVSHSSPLGATAAETEDAVPEGFDVPGVNAVTEGLHVPAEIDVTDGSDMPVENDMQDGGSHCRIARGLLAVLAFLGFSGGERQCRDGGLGRYPEECDHG